MAGFCALKGARAPRPGYPEPACVSQSQPSVSREAQTPSLVGGSPYTLPGTPPNNPGYVHLTTPLATTLLVLNECV